MVRYVPRSTKAVGFWSAVLATVFSIGYDVEQIAEWMGLMGSGRGSWSPDRTRGTPKAVTLPSQEVPGPSIRSDRHVAINSETLGRR